MKKYSAFTLAEITVAMIIVMIISAFGVSYFKPNSQKARLFLYGAIMNLQKGNTAISSKYTFLEPRFPNSASCPPDKYSMGCIECSTGAKCNSEGQCSCTKCAIGYGTPAGPGADYANPTAWAPGGTAINVCISENEENPSFPIIDKNQDLYCLRLQDNFALKKPADCSTDNGAISTGDPRVNLEFENGLTVQGLSTPWQTKAGLTYKYKDFVIDIDGNKGANKVWVDRFPLRVYSGDTKNAVVTPVNCINGQDIAYKKATETTTEAVTLTTNPYCKQKWSADGSYANKNFLLDNQVISYDIYKLDSSEEDSLARIIIPNVSLLRASCIGYGHEGMFDKQECAKHNDTLEDGTVKTGIKMDKRCVTSYACKRCWQDSSANYCPWGENGEEITSLSACETLREKYNPENITCFMLPHRPSASAGVIFNGMLDNVDL